jgi:CTP:phosphocholine cytidylyltransferase-like protein
MQLLLQTQKESVLEKLQVVFQEEMKDWWEEMSCEEKKEIEVGIEQADQEKFVSNSEVAKLFHKWP